MTLLCWICLLLALFPAGLFILNLKLYRQPALTNSIPPRVSVLIPARNEERSIREAVQTALISTGVKLEIIVLDDHSTDRTAQIVAEMSTADPRVRLAHAPELPDGWCGKQFACHTLSQLATAPILCFVDADVRLATNALARLTVALQTNKADLISGFPLEETETAFEKLLLPLMHFVLLGFLPIIYMRRSTAPAYAAGCGQIIIATRGGYQESGGHAAIKASRHDGIMLPKAFRRVGLATDLYDLTNLARCRMYTNAREVFTGLAKNATEGIAAPARILPFTFILLLGQVVPFALLPFVWHAPTLRMLCLLACLFAYLPRALAVFRFRQPWIGAILHPFGVATLLGIQWWALLRFVAGKPVSWKDRSYSAARSM